MISWIYNLQTIFTHQKSIPQNLWPTQILIFQNVWHHQTCWSHTIFILQHSLSPKNLNIPQKLRPPKKNHSKFLFPKMWSTNFKFPKKLPKKCWSPKHFDSLKIMTLKTFFLSNSFYLPKMLVSFYPLWPLKMLTHQKF